MRFLIVTFSILSILVVAALVGPSFVDWNKYKSQIITQVEKATGLNVQINGDLSLAILPSPRVKIEELVVVAPKKQKFENILTMKSAEVSVNLLPLLQKQVKVDSVTLIDPVIQIEIMEDGTPSWETAKLSQGKEAEKLAKDILDEDGVASAPQPASSQAMDSIALDKLTIENGQLSFIDHATNAAYAAQDINVVLEANSLNGPFEGQGSALYDNKKIALDFKTGRLPKAGEVLELNAKLSLPDANADASFNGVTTIQAPFDVQGQTEINVGSPAQLAQLFGSTAPFNDAVSLDGLLTATDNKIQYNDLKFSIGDFVANGKLSVDNLKAKNPLVVTGALKSNSILNLDKFTASKTVKKPQSTNDNLKIIGAGQTKTKSLVPQTLTLPMPLNVNMQVDVAGVKTQGQNIEGVFLDFKKTDKNIEANFKVNNMAGQSRANGKMLIAYGSSSASPKSGQVTYSDPKITYMIDVQVGQIKSLLAAFAPDVDASAVTDLYQSAQFDLDGTINGNSVSLKDSTLKLDQMIIGLGGQYVVPNQGGRAKASISLQAGSVDFDKILASQGKSPFQSSGAKSSASASSPKEKLKPLQNFSLPLDLAFDVSLQKAIINQSTLEGLRVKGEMTGNRLALDTASVNNFAGATMNAKGVMDNLNALTGMDMTFYAKTADVKKLASALKIDPSKLPATLNALEAQVKATGSTDALAFDANVKSMGGQVDVAGNAADLLGTPAYKNLTIGLTHPNLVKAIQVVSPDFKSQAGLAQAINLKTNADITDSLIKLSNMNITLGKSTFGGNLDIGTKGTVKSVKGTIKAGEIALDDLLGAKTASSKTASNPSGNASASSGSSERWSKTPIDLSWMNTLDVDVNFSASSIKYGTWNFMQPSTALKIGNGQMKIDNMKAGVFGGNATLNTEVKASPVNLNITTDMSNIDLEKLVTALSGSSKLKTAGTVSFDLSANATGASANALVNALNGKANLNGTDVTLKGFDLAKLARGLATEEKLITSAMSVVNGALSGGQTKFDTVKGDYKITNGVVLINSMAMDSVDAIIESTGSADLPKWFINVDNTITLKNVEGLDPFEVKIKGPIDKPANTFGKNILQDYVQDKIKRKITKELPDILGGDTTKQLQKFGILPQDKTPVTPTVPANDNAVTPDAQPAAPAVAPVEPAPKKKIEKPEDAINEFMKGDNPEEAIGNVLKGLF